MPLTSDDMPLLPQQPDAEPKQEQPLAEPAAEPTLGDGTVVSEDVIQDSALDALFDDGAEIKSHAIMPSPPASRRLKIHGLRGSVGGVQFDNDHCSVNPVSEEDETVLRLQYKNAVIEVLD